MIRNSWYVAGLSRDFKYKLEKKVIKGFQLHYALRTLKRLAGRTAAPAHGQRKGR